MTNRTFAKTRPNRSLLILLVSLLLAVFSMPALAQDISKEGKTKKADISKTLDRTKDQSKALDKDKTKENKDLGLSTGPADSKGVNEEKRSPEEIDKLKKAGYFRPLAAFGAATRRQASQGAQAANMDEKTARAEAGAR